MNDSIMKAKFRISFEEETGYVVVGTKRMSVDEAADMFRLKMFNTLKAMENGYLSKAITLSVKEVKL